MRRTRLSACQAKPIEQMTFEGRWEYACPYCGSLIRFRPGGKKGAGEEEPRCAACGQQIVLPKGEELKR